MRRGRSRMWRGAIPLAVALAMPVWVAAQATGDGTESAKESSTSGCVTNIPDTQTYVLATSDACILLEGNFDAKKIADHVATLKGVLQEGHRKRLEVHAIESVGDACTQTCKLPAMTRGLHGKELPGGKGGTAGDKPSTEPQPQPQ